MLKIEVEQSWPQGIELGNLLDTGGQGKLTVSREGFSSPIERFSVAGSSYRMDGADICLVLAALLCSLF